MYHSVGTYPYDSQAIRNRSTFGESQSPEQERTRGDNHYISCPSSSLTCGIFVAAHKETANVETYLYICAIQNLVTNADRHLHVCAMQNCIYLLIFAFVVYFVMFLAAQVVTVEWIMIREKRIEKGADGSDHGIICGIILEPAWRD
jgi:hypothetical protein